MKKVLFLSACAFFFMFSCSDISLEDEGERGGTGRNGKGTDGKQSKTGSSRVKKVCKGQSYTIYSYDDCPEDTGSGVGISSVGSSKKAVDILFVIDTSHSMYFYLNHAFKKRFQNFVSIVNTNLDWRMMFTNAGYSKGGFWSFLSSAMNGKAMCVESEEKVLDRNYLDNTLPYYKDIFRYTITRDPERIDYDDRGQTENECSYPPHCQGNEQPLRALKASFSANKHITRKEADFVAVIITNTDEDPGKDSPPLKTKEIINEFEKVYGSSKRLMVMNLIVLPKDKKCLKENNDHQMFFAQTEMGERIFDLATQTGGGNFSICLKDYSIVAKTIVELSVQ